jgi:2-polyprenyl-3-methyl-5-hydroxy-6-metoxy-1,4-benzoquinol methylase
MRNATEPTSTNMYYRQPRPEMLRLVPTTAQHVLDLGCAEGAFAAAVKERTGAEVWGVELNPQAAEHARAVVDRVLVGDADERIAELPDTYFDAIVCNDILEHLVNPGATLAHLRLKLKPGGVVVASIPNIRFAPALSKVVFRKDFPQDDEGIFDRTHLASSRARASCDCSRQPASPSCASRASTLTTGPSAFCYFPELGLLR